MHNIWLMMAPKKLISSAFITTIFTLFLSNNVSAQVYELDKMEVLFAQQHYKILYRRANRFLDNPEYDYSWMPEYYQALALLELNAKELWRMRHKDGLDRAVETFQMMKGALDGQRLLKAHVYELSTLKSDLTAQLEDFKRRGMDKEFTKLQSVMRTIFEDVPLIDEGFVKTDPVIAEEREFEFDAKNTAEMIEFASTQIGVPYAYGGTTPTGFDCSGFTSYVYSAYKIQLPRRAVDQYEKSKKLKQKQVQKGDLVFFDNGSGISHVGIIVSNPGEPLSMIHASSSKGIIVTNIENSEYWTKRLAGFGTYLR